MTDDKTMTADELMDGHKIEVLATGLDRKDKAIRFQDTHEGDVWWDGEDWGSYPHRSRYETFDEAYRVATEIVRADQRAIRETEK